MFQVVRISSMGALLGALVLASGPAWSAEWKAPAKKELRSLPQNSGRGPSEPAASDSSGTGTKSRVSQSEQAAPQDEPPKKELSPAMAGLRDRLRRALEALSRQPLNTRDNTVAEIIYFCQAFGCETEVREGGASGQKLNGITCLCWNIPCSGYEPLMLCDGRLAARIGYGYQDTPSQLAAMLALARVPHDYPARAGDTVRTVEDLIEHEKATCRSGADQSLKLIALAYYALEPKWKNALGEEWSLARLVKEEMGRTGGPSVQGTTNRLLAFSWTLHWRNRRKLPIDGEFLRARNYVDQSHDYVLRTQNSDGSWGRASNRDSTVVISTTGHVLEWLVMSLPDTRLEEPQVVQAIEYATNLLGSQRYQWNISSLSPREIEGAMCSAHALAVYDYRVFAPATPPPETPAPKETREKPAKPAKEKAQKVARRASDK